MSPIEVIHFDGPCPFLTCLKTGPHDHPICPACGAVRFGNFFCDTCRAHRPEREAELRDYFVDLWEMEVTGDKD